MGDHLKTAKHHQPHIGTACNHLSVLLRLASISYIMI